jgi:hypothetical protein
LQTTVPSLKIGSRRDIELLVGARILYDHCAAAVRWGMMPHTAGKTVAMYFAQPVANLREFLPDEAIPPIKMGDGEAPVVEELKYLGSMLSKNLGDVDHRNQHHRLQNFLNSSP